MKYKKVIKNGIACAVLLFCLGIVTGKAQEAITASGGDATGSGGSSAYSLGQVVYTSNTGTTGSNNQGVQQPYEIFIVGIRGALSTSLSIYPNPAGDNLILVTEDFQKDLTWKLFNTQGELLEFRKIKAKETQIYTGSLFPATYILNVTEENKIVQSFKVIKY